MNKKILLVLFFLSLFFAGCAKKIAIKALEPAEVSSISKTKRVAVLNFKGDSVGLSRKIEARLAAYKINNKKYFTVLGRNDIDAIMKELRLQSSGLVDEKRVVKLGSLIGADAIVSGEVRKPTKEDTYFYEKRVRCADEKCSKLLNYKVRCMKHVVGLAAEVRVVGIARGDVIYGDTFNKIATYKHCSDDSQALPSKTVAAEALANMIARTFTYKLTPHYRTFYVTLLEKPDIDYTDDEEQLLKVALEYIEQGRYDKAEKFLKRLIDATDEKSYVAFYNLGVIKEAEGKYQEAQEYYAYADNLMVEPVDEINKAVERISVLIKKREETLKQLQRQ